MVGFTMSTKEQWKKKATVEIGSFKCWERLPYDVGGVVISALGAAAC